MRIFVKYGRDGDVVSVSKVNVMPKHVEQPYVELAAGESVLEIPADTPLANLEVGQIHDGYKVDVKNKKLMEKP